MTAPKRGYKYFMLSYARGANHTTGDKTRQRAIEVVLSTNVDSDEFTTAAIVIGGGVAVRQLEGNKQ